MDRTKNADGPDKGRGLYGLIVEDAVKLLGKVRYMYLANLKNARLEAGYSQADLGAIVGITGSMVSYLESGDRIPSFGVAVRLAEAIGTTLDELISSPEFAA